MSVVRTYLPMILLGDSQVGKTSLSMKTVNNEFKVNLLSTIGKDFLEKKITIKGHSIKIKIYDTAGQEKFRSIAISAVRNAVGIILVYAIDNKNTFEALDGWLKDINDADKGKPIVIVGNKCDLPEEKRTVTYEEGKKYADEHGYNFYECSAKSGENVDKAFDDIFMQMYNKHEKEFDTNEQKKLKLKKNNGKKEKEKKKC